MASNGIDIDEWEELNQLIVNKINSNNQDAEVSEPPSPSPSPEVMYRFVLGKWWTRYDLLRMLIRRSTTITPGLPVWYRRDLEQCTWSPEKVPSKVGAVCHVSRDGIVKTWSNADRPMRWYRRDLEQCTLSPNIASSEFGAVNHVSRYSIVKNWSSEKTDL